MNTTRLALPVVLTSLLLACSTPTPIAAPTAVPTAASTSAANPALLHFENQWVALDYPKGLNVYGAGDAAFQWHPPVDLGGELVVGLGDPDPRFYGGHTYSRLIRISRLTVCPCDSLEKVMDETYQAQDAKDPLAESPFKAPDTVNVSEIPAAQKAYRIFWGEPAYDLRDIWVRRGGNVFIISISTRWSNEAELADFESMADRVVQSIVIK